MNPKFNYLYLLIFILLIGCGNSNTDKKVEDNLIKANADVSSGETQQGEIAGEWEQLYTCFDKNGNYKLEPEEKKLQVQNWVLLGSSSMQTGVACGIRM